MKKLNFAALAAACMVMAVANAGFASTIPGSYTVDAKDLKGNAPAGTMITFELHEDAACSAAIASDTVDIDDVVVVESLKTAKVKGGAKRAQTARLNHVFTGVSPSAGADLFVRVSASAGITAVDGACQAQEPFGGGGAAAAAGYGHVFNLGGQTVALESDVVFDSNGALSSDIAHTPGTSSIVIATTGIWQVSWIVTAIEPNQFALFLNGTAVPSGTYGSGAGTQQNSGQAILSLSAGDVVSLRNHASSSAVTLHDSAGGSQPNVNASIIFWQR